MFIVHYLQWLFSHRGGEECGSTSGQKLWMYCSVENVSVVGGKRMCIYSYVENVGTLVGGGCGYTVWWRERRMQLHFNNKVCYRPLRFIHEFRSFPHPTTAFFIRINFISVM